MSSKLIAAVFLLASAAYGQMWTNVQTGAVAPQPSRRPADAVNVSEEWFILPGWQPFDLAQQAAWDAAEAVAQADAAAARLATAKAGANGQIQKRIENIESVLGIRE